VNWALIARWCGLGAFAMAVWLLAPVVTCTFDVFRDTPIGEVDHQAAPSSTDKGRVLEGEGFAGKLVGGAKSCYRRTPFFGQERWKSVIFIALLAVAFVCMLFARATRGRGRAR
jgi:hypothetical protein